LIDFAQFGGVGVGSGRRPLNADISAEYGFGLLVEYRQYIGFQIGFPDRNDGTGVFAVLPLRITAEPVCAVFVLTLAAHRVAAFDAYHLAGEGVGRVWRNLNGLRLFIYRLPRCLYSVKHIAADNGVVSVRDTYPFGRVNINLLVIDCFSACSTQSPVAPKRA
jgi:hypothetical protein